MVAMGEDCWVSQGYDRKGWGYGWGLGPLHSEDTPESLVCRLVPPEKFSCSYILSLVMELGHSFLLEGVGYGKVKPLGRKRKMLVL